MDGGKTRKMSKCGGKGKTGEKGKGREDGVGGRH